MLDDEEGYTIAATIMATRAAAPIFLLFALALLPI
jgi:hypothetical protein